jgi:hypothetical protein
LKNVVEKLFAPGKSGRKNEAKEFEEYIRSYKSVF